MKPLPLVTALLLCTLLTGCAGEEYTYVDDAELKSGPGLFSGEDGVFTIHGKSHSERQQEQEEREKGTSSVQDSGKK